MLIRKEIKHWLKMFAFKEVRSHWIMPFKTQGINSVENPKCGPTIYFYIMHTNIKDHKYITQPV